MNEDRPPTIDPVAAERWHRAAPARSPWLHEEVGRRMQERLEWIKLKPATWADWEPVRGGLEAHDLVQQRYPQAQCVVHEPDPRRGTVAATQFIKPWWRRLGPRNAEMGQLADGQAQMLWSNMALHMSAEPQALIARWHRAVATDGFLMFSCLGPDSLRELRSAYGALGWPPPAHDFTDMHDWGDMLVHAGFAEPVMDMERITLTWETAPRMLQELRELGANLHPQRSGALRSRSFRQRLERELTARVMDPDGRLALTFEIVYGHAFKPAPRVRVSESSSVSLQEMRTLLRGGRTPQ